jgi:hypothetical protein
VYHVVLILLSLVLTYLAYQLVMSSPRALSMLLPKGLSIGIGVFMLVLGVFAAFLSAYILKDAGDMLRCFVQCYVGLWWILATSSSMRGSYSDDQMIRRLFMMMGLLMLAMIAVIYVKDPRHIATINLLLVTGGFWITSNYFRWLDRGR